MESSETRFLLAVKERLEGIRSNDIRQESGIQEPIIEITSWYKERRKDAYVSGWNTQAGYEL